MSSCLYLHPSGFQVAASFVDFIICCYTPPLWLIVCFYVCTYLFFFSPPWTFEHHSFVRLCITTFFFCAPLLPSVLSLPPLSLSWFGNALGFSEWWWLLRKLNDLVVRLTAFSKNQFKQPHNSSVKSAIRAQDYSHSDGLHSCERFKLWNTAVR